VRRVLGIKFFSASQLAEKCGLSEKKSKAAVNYFLKTKMAVPYIATRCLHCGYVWPEYEADEEIEEAVLCPLCNEYSESEDATFYIVYRMVSPPPTDNDESG